MSATVCLASCGHMCMDVYVCVCVVLQISLCAVRSFSEALQVCVFRNVSLVRLRIFL